MMYVACSPALRRRAQSMKSVCRLALCRKRNNGRSQIGELASLDARAETGLIRHWESEISNFVQQQQIVDDLLLGR